ncbi:MAG: YdeI/OmpD-associated family protein [Acidobacteriota bacterium]
MAKRQDHVKFKTEITHSSTGSGWHFLMIDKKIVDKFGFPDKFKRVICSINGSGGFQCALLPWQQMFYIIVNKKKRDALGIVSGDIVDVELVRDESQYGLPMPEEFREVLDQDPDGDRLFHALTKGKQRSVLYHIGNVKDIDRRIHVALIFVEHLKNNDGKILNKILMEELKRPIF